MSLYYNGFDWVEKETGKKVILDPEDEVRKDNGATGGWVFTFNHVVNDKVVEVIEKENKK